MVCATAEGSMAVRVMFWCGRLRWRARAVKAATVCCACSWDQERSRVADPENLKHAACALGKGVGTTAQRREKKLEERVCEEIIARWSHVCTRPTIYHEDVSEHPRGLGAREADSGRHVDIHLAEALRCWDAGE